MKVVCPNCRVPVAAEDIDLSSGLAKCRTCNNVFRIAEAAPELAAAPARVRPDVERPANITLAQSAEGLAIDYRWFTPKYLFLALFCLIWDGFLVTWYGLAVGSGNWLVLVFPILHVAAGIAITYVTIAGFLNTTSVRISRDRLRVWHHPIPVGRAVDLAIGDVKQLFCEEKRYRSKYGWRYSYDLMAVLGGGTRKRLLANIATPQLPTYLEQHAEAWLGIRDEPVVGEYWR